MGSTAGFSQRTLLGGSAARSTATIGRCAEEKTKRDEDMDLSKITTQHPGGYPDIFEELKRNNSHLIRWETTKQIQDPEDPTKWINYKENHSISCGEIFNEISDLLKSEPNRDVTGCAASIVQKILAKYNLPISVDKKWLQPAMMWFV
jgi:hypothetical protein